MADTDDLAASAVSRVPLEIWTQIIKETIILGTVNQSMQDARIFRGQIRHVRDFDEVSRVWRECRLVSHKFKAATEAAFTEILLLTNPKPQLSLGIWCPYIHVIQAMLDPAMLDLPLPEIKSLYLELDRLVFEDGEQRAVWKPGTDDGESNWEFLKLWLPGNMYYLGPAISKYYMPCLVEHQNLVIKGLRPHDSAQRHWL